jgi:branched-chain amino acid transport system ATP-binding protein
MSGGNEQDGGLILEASGVVKTYGAVRALHDASLSVRPGEVHGLLGANGAGKSTSLMSIMRLPPPEGPVITTGRISYNGVDLLGVSTHTVVGRHGIGLVPEGRHIFGNLTVQENLKLATYARKDSAQISQDYERVFALFPRLADRRHQRGDTLSGGEQQMLAMGRAFMSGVRFILLDEPSMGLAPLLMQELFRVLKQINEAGATILVVEQNARLALKYAHRGYVLEAGRIVMEGPSEELAKNPQIQKAYLG